MNSANQNTVNQNGSDHIAEDDLMLFALQFLSKDQNAAVLQHLEQCALCRQQLGAIEGDLAAYALSAELQEPPAQARERFMSRVAHEKHDKQENQERQESQLLSAETGATGSVAAGPGEAAQNRPGAGTAPVVASATAPVVLPQPTPALEPVLRERRGVAILTMAWAGWALAAAIGFFAFLQFQQRQSLQRSIATEDASLNQVTQQAAEARESATQALISATRAREALQTLTSSGAMQVSLHLPAVRAPQPEAHAAYIQRTGALVLVASHLTPLAPGKTYQLWLLPVNPQRPPVPAGLFKPNATGYASVVLPELPKGIAAKGFGVTIEPDGGSSAPTPPIILAGAGS